MGESAARVDRSSPDLAGTHPELELRQIKDARNFIAHSYDLIEHEVVWNIMSTDLPRATAKIAAFLESAD